MKVEVERGWKDASRPSWVTTDTLRRGTKGSGRHIPFRQEQSVVRISGRHPDQIDLAKLAGIVALLYILV